MNLSNIHKIKRRIFGHEQLISDSSICPIYYSNLNNWHLIGRGYKAIRHLQIPLSSISILKEYLLRPAYFAVYEILNPLVIVFKWPNGELKFFLLTQNGHLLDPCESSAWDIYFPFLSHDLQTNVLASISIPKDVIPVEIDNWIWYPNHNNYTHFFFDSFVHVAFAQQVLQQKYINKYQLPLIHKAPGWQVELIDRLSPQKYFHPSIDDHQSFQIFHVKKLMLPVLSHRIMSLDWLRGYLAAAFLKDSLNSIRDSKTIDLIMVTRYDDRRRRITNIDEIESLVVNYGGSLIDASCHSISEKFILFNQCKVCIAESSGCMNFALFSPESSHLIALTDPSVVNKSEFVPGGWDYITGYANRTSFVIGEDPIDLAGSPLGSATYSLVAIKALLLKYLS